MESEESPKRKKAKLNEGKAEEVGSAIQISLADYLVDREKIKPRYGFCKVCKQLVYLSVQKLSSHKRKSCVGITSKEVKIFRGETTTMKAGPASGKPLTFCQDTVSKSEQKKLDGLVGDFVFRGALSFRVMESGAAKKMFAGLRPAYQSPSAKVIGSRLLNEKYDEIKLKFLIKIRECSYYSLAVDGWTNVARTHLLNFVVILPSGDTLLWKTLDVSKDIKNAENTKNAIVSVAKEISLAKWIALLQDNANMCQKVSDLIEAEYPLVFCNGCLAHGLNLFIKNVCDLPVIKELFANATILVNTVNNHSRIHSYYTENIRQQLNIENALQSTVITRFYTFYTQGNSVLDNKVGLTRLVVEHMDLLSNVLSPTALAKFVEIVNSSSFWTNMRYPN